MKKIICIAAVLVMNTNAGFLQKLDVFGWFKKPSYHDEVSDDITIRKD